jgi:RimJ/RimL family protein N-acetyltransferase
VPTIRILQPGDQAALEAFCLPRVESSMFLIGNSRTAGLVDRGQPYEGTYAAAFEGQDIVGVVAHYWNRMLVPQATDHLDTLWRAAVRASGRSIGGVIGPDNQVNALKELLGLGAADAPSAGGSSADDPRVQMDDAEKLYRLSLDELVVPEGLRSGRLVARRIEAGDVDLIVRWRVGLSVESLNEEDTPELRERLRASVERSIGERRTWVLEAGGVPVATSNFNAAIREAVQIGGVYTPPECRRRGYARAVVAASLLDAQANGVATAILFTGHDNLPAQRAYAALGFRHIGEYRLLTLQEPLEKY